MPRIAYKSHNFANSSLAIIEQANAIIAEYSAQGFDLTLRQLYYQFVARALIENSDKSYDRIGSIINDARLAGYIDWDSIVDRTRHLRESAHWESPADIIESCAAQFKFDKWEDQKIRVEVWIEKDALVGVLEGLCREEDVPLFSCRGYTSQSAQWRAGRRMFERAEKDPPQDTVVLHLGDHDPSGIDMTRDNGSRLWTFMEQHADHLTFKRIALNMKQVRKYDPPPNPAKLTDSRAKKYIPKYGYDSWELDALDPVTLNKIVKKHIYKRRDDNLWQKQLEREQQARVKLGVVANTLRVDEGFYDEDED